MRIAYSFFLILGLGFLKVQGCEIQSDSVYLAFERPFSKKLKATTCPQILVDIFFQKLSRVQGEVRTRQLGYDLLSDGHKVSITPDKILVLDVKDYLKKQIGLTQKQAIKNIKDQTGLRVYSYASIEEIKTHCQNCTRHGSHWISFKGGPGLPTRWGKLEIVPKTFAYRARNTIPAMEKGLDPDNFEQVEILSSPNQSAPFLDMEKLSYYKTNRIIHNGEVLVQSALSTYPLVQSGETVSLIIEGENIALKTKAKAIESGGLNQKIRCQNQKSKKIIEAKVTGHKTLEMKL